MDFEAILTILYLHVWVSFPSPRSKHTWRQWVWTGLKAGRWTCPVCALVIYVRYGNELWVYGREWFPFCLICRPCLPWHPSPLSFSSFFTLSISLLVSQRTRCKSSPSKCPTYVSLNVFVSLISLTFLMWKKITTWSPGAWKCIGPKWGAAELTVSLGVSAAPVQAALGVGPLPQGPGEHGWDETGNIVDWTAKAAITRFYGCGGFEPQKYTASQLWTLKAPNQGILRVGFLRGNLSLEVGTFPWASRGLSSVQVSVPRAGECPLCGYVSASSFSFLIRTPVLLDCVCSSIQLCLTLCNPMDCSPPGSSVRGILQARTLEWVAVPSSRGYYWPKDRTHVSCTSCLGRWILYHWVFEPGLMTSF